MRAVERVCAVDVAVSARPGPGAPVRSPARPRLAPSAAGFAVVALAVAVDPAGLRPHTSLRWLLVSTAISAAAWSVARHGPPRLPRWFLTAGAVLVSSMVVSAVVTGDHATAWLGHPQRHLGVVAWLVFGAAAVAGASLPRTGAPGQLLPRACVVAGSVTGVVAVADLAGWDPLGDDFAGGRIGGLLGQPTTLGALAVLLLPMVVAARVDRRVRVATIAGLLLTVLGTQTRGALVGAVAVGVVSLPAILPRLRRSTAVLVAAAAVAAVLVAPAGARVLDVAGSGRLDEWRLAGRVLADHPLLGVGPEGYRIAVLGALDEGYVERHGREVMIDRAHSAPLDVAVTGGVGAGLASVVLLAGVAVTTWRRQRDEPWSVPAAAGAGAVGVMAAGLVAFPVAELDAIAWLLAGLAVGTRPRPPWPTGRARRLATSAAAVLLVVCLVAGATDVVADRWLEEGRSRSGRGDVAGATAAADRATALRPDLVDAWYVAAQVAATGPTILHLDAGIARAAEGLRRSPRDPALRSLHASLLGERALRTELARDRSHAVQVLEGVLADDPTNAALRDRLTEVRAVTVGRRR